MAQRPVRKEPSYQIGIPLDGSDDSALQPGDRYDQEETAQDYVAPPPSEHPSTEVALPQEIEMEEEPAPQPVPTTDVALPVAPPAPVPRRRGRTDAAATSSRSGAPRGQGPARQAGSRSSRRLAATSGAAPVSSRRFSAVDRGAWQKSLLWVGLGLLVALIAVAAVVLLAARESPGRRLAVEALAEAGRQSELARNALVNRRGAEARHAYAAALDALTKTPQLGGAIAMPPEDPTVIRDLALQANGLRNEIEPLDARIAQIESENAAEANLAALKVRCATIGSADTDLEQLDRDIRAYIENPVDPRSGPSQSNATAFSRLVADANLRLASITTERDRRKAARTAIPLRLAAVEVDGLVQQERFGEALGKLDALARQHPDADFNPLRAMVEDSAAKAWRSAKSQYETRLADWKSPGATEVQRKTGLAGAKERMNQVIQRYGMPQYVDQARALLTPLP
jgi:tetratricopeptide (TPR) repeat protein